jgi:hypothetical protein
MQKAKERKPEVKAGWEIGEKDRKTGTESRWLLVVF